MQKLIEGVARIATKCLAIGKRADSHDLRTAAPEKSS